LHISLLEENSKVYVTSNGAQIELFDLAARVATLESDLKAANKKIDNLASTTSNEVGDLAATHTADFKAANEKIDNLASTTSNEVGDLVDQVQDLVIQLNETQEHAEETRRGIGRCSDKRSFYTASGCISDMQIPEGTGLSTCAEDRFGRIEVRKQE
jgi:predicted  nucleic acid-binding Zn-ribbon protein